MAHAARRFEMTYRRDDKPRKFAKWRHEHNELIGTARVPDFVMESHQNWLNFLDNGYLEEHGPSRHFDYDVRLLPGDEQEALLQLIETYPCGPESEAARRLRNALKNAN